MKNLTADKALSLLLKDVIRTKDDLGKSENRWVKHCIFVAIAAGRIARRLNIDEERAIVAGYVHDIGRKISHELHPINGYDYLMRFGYEEEARYCITHSFIYNDINLTAGEGPSGDAYNFMYNYMDSKTLTIYDSIVQLCDLFCLETGFTTIERRMLDITKRKGVTANSLKHFESVIRLKEKIEEHLKCKLYILFPEIDKEVLDNRDNDFQELMHIIKKNDVELCLTKNN